MLKFISPETQNARRLAEVSDPFCDRGFVVAQSKKYPLKPSRKVAELVVLGRTAEITLVEWSSFFSDEQFWAGLPLRQDEESLVLNIFSEVEINSALRRLILTKAAISIEAKHKQLPAILMTKFDLLKDSLMGYDSLCFKLIHAFQMGSKDELIEGLVANQLSPVGLLSLVGWPNFSRMKQALEEMLLLCLKNLDWDDNKVLLLECLKSFQGSNLICFLDGFLLLSKDKTLPKSHLDWLYQHANPESEAVWSRISSPSRSSLTGLLSLNLFPVYLSAIKKMVERCPNCFGGNDEYGESRRVRSRMMFWSNYSKKMISSRLLLQKKAYTQLTNMLGSVGAEEFVNGLDNDDYHSEWLIIEFEECVILEQLSQSWGAVRIFKKTLIVETSFLEKKSLSLNQLLLRYQDDIHDHHIFWQWSLEAKLRSEFNIFPNEGLTSFLGIPRDVSDYSFSDGLSEPDASLLLDRLAEVKRWEESFYRHEKSFYRNEKLLKEYNSSDKKIGVSTPLKNHLTKLGAYFLDEKQKIKCAITLLKSVFLEEGRPGDINEAKKIIRDKTLSDPRFSLFLECSEHEFLYMELFDIAVETGMLVKRRNHYEISKPLLHQDPGKGVTTQMVINTAIAILSRCKDRRCTTRELTIETLRELGFVTFTTYLKIEIDKILLNELVYAGVTANATHYIYEDNE